MHRLGESLDHVFEIASIVRLRNLRIDGVFTHLSTSDSLEPEDIEFTKRQIERFYLVLDALRPLSITLPKIHVQSSYGILRYPELQCCYARIGIALYGVLSLPGEQTNMS